MSTRLPIEEILSSTPGSIYPRHAIGRTRDDRMLFGATFGEGAVRVSLVAGCHADEPVGPAMLDLLAAYLATLPPTSPLLAEFSWTLVPHANPDGDARNAAWAKSTVATTDHRGAPDRGYLLTEYARQVVREPPGDDMEFGFPRDDADASARPENRAIAAFLRSHGPFDLHGSLHGMAWAPGPWFLIERAWADRTMDLRRHLLQTVHRMGYEVLDWDRQGDKGFDRVDVGFSTRPDSLAMRRHFEALDDLETAALFRPSSMEFVRSLGGDPFTFVSEMPLFLHPDPTILSTRRIEFRQRLEQATHGDAEAGRRFLERERIRPMPLRDQMRLQLAFVQAAIDVVVADDGQRAF